MNFVTPQLPSLLRHLLSASPVQRCARLAVLAASLASAAGLSASAASVNLKYEGATSPEGPWKAVPSEEVTHQADGSVTFDAEGLRFFRLRIEGDGDSNAVSVIRIGALPTASAVRLSTRVAELGRFLRPLVPVPGNETNPPSQSPLEGFAGVAAWQGARFASNAIPIYDPAWMGGREPAYVEIKVLAPNASGPGNGLRGSSREQNAQRGSILLSLGDEDVGIPFFSTEGETPAERLVEQLGLTDAAGRRVLTPPPGHRVMRFGPVFHVLENAAGQAVASLGAQPFKLPSDLLTRFPGGSRGEGNPSDPEPANNQTLGRSLGFGHYTSYADFKKDYLVNPTYIALRARRALRAKAEIDIESGRIPAAPQTVTLALGQSTLLFPGTDPDRFFLDDDDSDLEQDPVVTVTRPRIGGGLQVSAKRLGEAELVVRTGRTLARVQITVALRLLPAAPALADTFTPGWQEPQVWDAGGYDEQPRYWQEKRDRWCDSVGCGPVAWAMLLAWWDRHGVPSAFAVGSGSSLRSSLRNQDAPFYLDNDDDPSGYARVIKLYDVLHESCDVICDLFSDAGATPPGDMVEAWWEPTKPGRRTDQNGTYWPYPAQPPPNPAMGHWYSWSWDLSDPDWNEPSNVIRRANKKGRPAIVGLGWLWHYGVSYAYRYQEYKATANGPAIHKRRWFRVNEGWGKDHGEWYSGGDTFLGFDLKLSQRHIPPP